MRKITILNVKIQNITSSELLESIRTGVIITPNIDQLVKLQKDYEFYKLVENADWVVCDSKILYFLGI